MIQPYYIPVILTDSNYSLTFQDFLIILLVVLFILFLMWFFTIGIEKIKDFKWKLDNGKDLHKW